MFKLEITLPFLTKPINAQSKNWRAVHADRKKIKESVAWRVKGLEPKHPLRKAWVECERHSSNSPDYDGLVSSFKSVIDGLTEAGVIEDDNMEIIGMPSFRWFKAPKGKGFIVIRVYDYDPYEPDTQSWIERPRGC
jgi:Holliday junction resolvase RusA-like endonuclease